MSHNTFGQLFRVTTWGESHGAAIGCVIDGCPPGLALDEAAVQPWLDRRRPGSSRFVTQRQEPDQVRILSGVFEGVTTGTPVAMEIVNQDQRSRDYGSIADSFRPGHADIAYHLKYGVRDPRGGGRSSARETAAFTPSCLTCRTAPAASMDTTRPTASSTARSGGPSSRRTSRFSGRIRRTSSSSAPS